MSPARADSTMKPSMSNNSAAPTPVLTNETNTPQSSSPPSTHASADGVATTETAKAGSINGVEAVAPQVQESEA